MKIFWTEKQFIKLKHKIQQKSHNKGHKEGYNQGYKNGISDGKKQSLPIILRALRENFDIFRKRKNNHNTNTNRNIPFVKKLLKHLY